jgi:hypothetical protein
MGQQQKMTASRRTCEGHCLDQGAKDVRRPACTGALCAKQRDPSCRRHGVARTLAPYRRQDPSGQNWGDNHDYLPLGRLLVVLHLELILVLVLDLEVALALVVGAVLLGPTLLTSSLLNLAALVVPDLAETMESASIQGGERDR